ncbi:MAG: hypothetical protein JSV35_03740 [Candidatus Bathyarchaeota archaeon]|nr:MAG: hypothetical protein JSV35_03740 [Candidatus Bathyarchaeota archaeon]
MTVDLFDGSQFLQEWWFMNEKALIAIAIISIGAIIVGVVFLTFSHQSPPVDVSGIDLPLFLNSTDLMPQELRGIEQEKGYTAYATVPHLYGGPGEYLVEHTTAIFDETTIHILRTAEGSAGEAYEGETLDIFYFNLSSQSETGVKTRASNWFLCDFEDLYAFFWGSDNWVFGVVSPTNFEGEDMANSFVQHLRRQSSSVID